jgi:hypothetical protein
MCHLAGEKYRMHICFFKSINKKTYASHMFKGHMLFLYVYCMKFPINRFIGNFCLFQNHKLFLAYLQQWSNTVANITILYRKYFHNIMRTLWKYSHINNNTVMNNNTKIWGEYILNILRMLWKYSNRVQPRWSYWNPSLIAVF